MFKLSKIFLSRIGIVIIILIHCLNTSKAQNYIRNGGFEEPLLMPITYLHQFQGYVPFWEDDKRLTNPSSGVFNVHSPDINYDPFLMIWTLPNSGQRQVNVGHYELIETCLNGILPSNEELLLNFHIKLHSSLTSVSFDNTILKVYLATEKIQYSLSNDYLCNTNFTTHHVPNNPYSEIEILSIPVDLVIYPVNGGNNGWHNISHRFLLGNGADVYKYIAFELINTVSSSNCQRAYIGMDDFSLTKVCDNFCVNPTNQPPTFGYFTNVTGSGCVLTGTWHQNSWLPDPVPVGSSSNAKFAFYVTGATKIDFTIWDRWGAGNNLLYSAHNYDLAGLKDAPYNCLGNTYYPSDKLIFWDGKHNNGSNLSIGAYVYQLEIENCNAKFQHTGKITFGGPGQYGTHNDVVISNLDFPNCCPENQVLNNVVIQNLSRIDVNDFISAGHTGPVTCSAGANIIWHAGNTIDLGSQFSSQGSNNWELAVVPCGTLRYGNTSSNFNLRNYISETISNNSKFEVRLLNNPTEDFIEYQCNLGVSHVEILTIDGKIVPLVNSNIFGQKINLSFLTAGIYLLKFTSVNGNIVVLRAVKI